MEPKDGEHGLAGRAQPPVKVRGRSALGVRPPLLTTLGSVLSVPSFWPLPPGQPQSARAQAGPCCRSQLRLSHTRGWPSSCASLGPAAHGGQRLPAALQAFVVFQTKELPVLQRLPGALQHQPGGGPGELLQPSCSGHPRRLAVSWKVRAFITSTPACRPAQPVAQVLFYVAGRGWDDFGVTERLPCVRLHAFRDAGRSRAPCASAGVWLHLPRAGRAAPGLVRAPGSRPAPQCPPSGWGWNPSDRGESASRALLHIHCPRCFGWVWGGPDRRRTRAGARAESPTQHPLLRIGSISLFRPPPGGPCRSTGWT